MKNKNLLVYLFFLLTPLFLQATHIVGGTIVYKQVQAGSYEIKLEVFRDCLNAVQAGFDSPAFLTVFHNGMVYNDFEMAYPGFNDTITTNPINNACVFPETVCINRAIYTSIIELPENTGVYTISYQRCCRSQILTNILNPLETGMTFTIEINTDIENSSPQFEQDIPLITFVNVPFTYSAKATDADGDSLVYELITPIVGATAAIPIVMTATAPPYDNVLFLLPNYSVDNMLGGNYPLTINPENGEMVAIPPSIGSFQVAYSVKEFREGIEIGMVRREFTFNTVFIDNSSDFSLSGNVLIDENTYLDEGKVELLWRDISNDSLYINDEIEIGEMGAYDFQNISPGVYYLRAIPDENSIYAQDYLPTYYRSNLFWYNSDVVSHCDTSQAHRDIFLIKNKSLSGDLSLGGFVKLEDNEEPVTNLQLILQTSAGEILQFKKTNEEGYFSFDNLPSGSYQVLVDLLNSQILNTQLPLINLNQSATYDFSLHPSFLELNGILSTPTIPAKEVLPFEIFPNPTQGNFVLQIDQPEKVISNTTLEIFNAQGKKVFAKELSKDELHDFDLNLNAGVYFARVMLNGNQHFKKLLVQ